MKKTTKKLTQAQALAVEYIEQNGSIPLKKINRHTLTALIKTGGCDYNDRFDALVFTEKYKQKPVKFNPLAHENQK